MSLRAGLCSDSGAKLCTSSCPSELRLISGVPHPFLHHFQLGTLLIPRHTRLRSKLTFSMDINGSATTRTFQRIVFGHPIYHLYSSYITSGHL